MANYALKYFKNISHKDGTIIRLEIYEKGPEQASVEIGNVIQDLVLQIQGQQGDIDTPIVKTSLSITLVDAFDLVDGRKNGFWEEFYTPDAIYWKVILKAKKAKETSFKTLWGGYVTPDSYSEDITYRGSVNIIARDNIGHMQDFTFDAKGDSNGLISLKELIEAAWAKIESPMVLKLNNDSSMPQWLVSGQQGALDSKMNVSVFEGKSWYDALTDALYSYGAVMRYVGNNVVSVTSLRYMPYQGEQYLFDVPRIVPVFERGASRELCPAIKAIEETTKYNLLKELSIQLVDNANDFTGEVVAINDIYTPSNITEYKTIYFNPIRNNKLGSGWINGVRPSYFNPSTLEWGGNAHSNERDLDSMWMASSYMTNTTHNNNEPRYIEYSRYISIMPFKIRMEMGYGYSSYDGKLSAIPYFPSGLLASLSITAQGITYHLTSEGEWVSSANDISIEISDGVMELDVPALDVTGLALLSFKVTYINVPALIDAYVPIYNLSIELHRNLLETNNVNTKYEEANNIILSRSPELGPAMDQVLLPNIIENGIFVGYDNISLPSKEWTWFGTKRMQMPVFIHQELIAFYSKPNNILNGTILNTDITNHKAIYQWNGKPHLLLSGNYDLISGYIEGAVLREFDRYEHMWETWADRDDITVDFGAVDIVLNVYASGVLSESMITNVPNWMTFTLQNKSGGAYEVTLQVSENGSGNVRSAILKIDTYDVRIIQTAAGDYGLDYGKDYS
jgi:hypothetical protein